MSHGFLTAVVTAACVAAFASQATAQSRATGVAPTPGAAAKKPEGTKQPAPGKKINLNTGRTN